MYHIAFFFWRALLQWLGGIGIIVMAIAILPMLSIGGMQLFKTESYETPDKVIPRAAIFASGISVVYIFLTSAWALMLWSAGMSTFDSSTCNDNARYWWVFNKVNISSSI